MKKEWMKRLNLMVMSVILVFAADFPVCAKKSISDLEKEKKQTQEKLDKANDSISSINEEKKGITAEINEMDDLLVEILASISLIEDEIDEKREQIEESRIKYEEAKAEEEKQYEAMKIRLQYMYKNGDESYVDLMLGAHGMSNSLNYPTYVEKVYEYDQKILDKYIKAREEVMAIKEKLELEESELVTSEAELKEEEKEMNLMLEEKKKQQKDYETQLAKAKQEAAAYKAKIKQQNAEIRKIQEEEERKRRAEEEARKKKNSSSSTSASDVIKNSGGSATGKEIANYACQFVGNPYVMGGTSLTNGADCSGFTYRVYKDFGYNIPRTSTAQRSAGVGVNYSEAQPGDIICYAGHVALYIGGGQIVHASTAATGIKYGTATYKTILAVRRIV